DEPPSSNRLSKFGSEPVTGYLFDARTESEFNRSRARRQSSVPDHRPGPRDARFRPISSRLETGARSRESARRASHLDAFATRRYLYEKPRRRRGLLSGQA